MARTYEPIASVTLGSDTQAEFTNIPATYTDLVLVIHYGVATAGQPLCLRVGNGSIDTGTNYSNTIVYGTGSAAGSYRDSTQSTAAAGTYYLGASTAIEHVSVVHLMSYANTNVYKTIMEASGSAGKGAERGVSLWRSTSAITHIRVGGSSALATNMKSGSTLSLFGLKAA